MGISRTTVENAYDKLCIEGIAESVPQKGYFITDFKKFGRNTLEFENEKEEIIKYDFSGRSIDTYLADTENWKKTVRNALLNSEELTSYGNAQGELVLRNALSSYIYKSRGVLSRPENMIIGAGLGPLLNILCRLMDKDIKIGFENGGFRQAESVFSDYGIDNIVLKSDNNGAIIESINESLVNVLFLLPSALPKISITALSKRRNEFLKWAEQDNRRIIIEDDYNGELRFTARTVPAFQSKNPQKTVYIGSFSKLLLPSVRLAFMVLPDSLTELFEKRKTDFNQTCGKIEQIALANYIINGNLEKHLRRLRRRYYSKSQLFISELNKNFPDCKTEVFETSLITELQTGLNVKSKEICEILYKNGIKVIESSKNGSIKLSFAGIKDGEIPVAVEYIKSIINKNW